MRPKLEKAIENEEAKTLWDFGIQIDKPLPHNTPNVTTINKKDKNEWALQYLETANRSDRAGEYHKIQIDLQIE